MLYGKVFRSTVPHGRIRQHRHAGGERTARRVSRRHRRRHSKLIPEPYYGPAFHDQPILALDKVRHVGEPVAVVLASDPHVAEQAVQLISAEYEELPAVYDEVEAMQPDVLVHDVLKPAGTFADLKHISRAASGTNVALDYHLRRGDAEKAMAGADHVFEHTFKTQQCLHLPFEPFVVIAEPGDEQADHLYREPDAVLRAHRDRAAVRLAGKPRARQGAVSRRRLRRQALHQARSAGRGAGDAGAPSGQDRADHGRAVLHDHQASRRRSASRAASTRAGASSRARCEVYWNGGAYADIGPRVAQKSGFTAAGPYDIDNVSIDSYAVYTNRTPAGALRGFGIPQLVWAYEMPHRSDRARARHRSGGIPPQEFAARRPPASERHRAAATPPFAEVLEALAERMSWNTPFDRGTGTLRRGRGIAIGFKASISPTTSVAIVNVSADGSSRSIPARSIWARARTRLMRRSSPKCSTFRPKTCASFIPIPT